MYRYIFVTSFLLMLPFLTYGQQSSDENPRKVGLTATVQSSQFDVLLPVWVSNQTVIGPSVSFVSVSDSGSELGIGAFSKFYFNTNTIAPYWGLRGGAVVGIPSGGDTVVDFITGLSVGGDYFIAEKFSLGVEVQGNFTISDDGSTRFGNPGGVNFNTASVITASLYF